MKTINGVITYYWDGEGKPQRIRDQIFWLLYQRGLYTVHDRWTIEKDGTNEPVGAYYHVAGPKTLIRIMSWLSNVHLGKAKYVELKTDENGCFTSAEEVP